jgi:hypothetical protein
MNTKAMGNGLMWRKKNWYNLSPKEFSDIFYKVLKHVHSLAWWFHIKEIHPTELIKDIHNASLSYVLVNVVLGNNWKKNM